jgi:NitT/TauT family transport system permease protein
MTVSPTVRLAPWLFTLAMLAIWEIAVRMLDIPVFFLPPPTVIAKAFVEFWRPIYTNSLITLSTTLIGFALAVGFGLMLGLVIGWSRTIYAGLYPLMIGFNAIPKVAVVPILVLWFGIGFLPAVLTAFLISFFPIVVNVATGLATIEPELEDVLKALGASKLDIMRKVGLPRALPYFFGSLKIAITLAFVGSVISESIASNNGIGNLMLQAQAQFQVPLVFAGLVALAVEGIVMYWAMALLERRMTGWAQRLRRPGAVPWRCRRRAVRAVPDRHPRGCRRRDRSLRASAVVHPPRSTIPYARRCGAAAPSHRTRSAPRRQEQRGLAR